MCVCVCVCVCRGSDKGLWTIKEKVKCTLVQALRLCTDRTAHRGSRGIALLFLDYGTRRRWGVSVTPQPLFAPGKGPVPIVQEAEWAPWTVCIGAENLASIGIRSPDLQPVASRYTDWDTGPTLWTIVWMKLTMMAAIPLSPTFM